MLKFHLAQRLHVHILSRAPLRAGDVFQNKKLQYQYCSDYNRHKYFCAEANFFVWLIGLKF